MAPGRRRPWASPRTSCCSAGSAGVRCVFLPRHGRGHPTPPSELNYRANIDALKRSGVTEILSLSAVGSLREDLPPGHFVIVDQFIDRTFAREKSFFGDGLRRACLDGPPGLPAARRRAGGGGAGPRLAGDARRHLPRDGGPAILHHGRERAVPQWGCDVIGMTNMPEAKLAREAELCYATVAMVTDFDCWHPDHDHVTVDQVVKVLLANADTARALVKAVVPGSARRAAPAPPAATGR